MWCGAGPSVVAVFASNPAALAKQERHHKDANRDGRSIKHYGIGLSHAGEQRAIDGTSSKTGTAPGPGKCAAG